MSILNARKKGGVNKGFLAIIAIVIIGGIALSCDSNLRKEVIANNSTTIQKTSATTTTSTKSADTKNISTTSTTSSNGNKVTPAVLTKMEQGYDAGNLGEISPMPSWYKPSEVAPNQNMLSSAESYSVPANEVADMIAGNSPMSPNQKEVFLTFDDGPSVQNTPQILNILKENDVHATFFLIGNQLKNNPEIQNIVRQEIMNGNAVGDHTFDHVLSQLYPNNEIDVNQFMTQVNECKQLEQDVLGPNFDTRILRLPGGYMSRVHYNDPNLPAFNKALDSENITAIDWTSDSGVAATTKEISPEQMLACSTKDWQDMPQDVLLMHDAGAKTDTVAGLPGVIKFFKAHGYKFMVIGNAPASSFENLSYTDVKTDSNQGQVAPTTNSNVKTA